MMIVQMKRRVGTLLFFPLAMATMAMAQDLPIRRVVIYKNGVGYIERTGEVTGGSSVSLSFRTEEMTDVLKSLSLSSTGAPVERVRFSTDESLEEKLKAFPFRIQPGESMASLLDELRGERIVATRSGQQVQGVILSAQTLPGNDQTPAKDAVTLWEAGGSISTYEIASFQQLRFENPRLQEQVGEYLRIVAEARNQERRAVNIDVAAGASAQLSARYMTPMPVWKSSYRMIFPKEGKPTLEGWAVVDNTSGEDWSNVNLSLISGRPVSFLTNLYPPINVSRPFVPLPGIGSTGPVTYESDMRVTSGAAPPPAPAAASPLAEMADEAVARRGMAKAGPERLQQFAMLNRPEAEEMRRSAIASTASGVEAGALFGYYFPDRVNVRKGESVMLPFVQKEVSAEQLLIFSEHQPVQNHPMLAFEMTNDSGYTLDGGPVTVFDGGEYAGEALFETTKVGDKRLMSYGVDVGTSLRIEPSSGTRNIQEVSMQRGILTIKSKQRTTIKYTASNADSDAKTLLIERTIRPNYETISPAVSSKTSNANRFRMQIPANASSTLEIVEEYPYAESLQVSNLDEDRMLLFTRNQAISTAARQGLERILAKKRELAENELQVAAMQARIRSLGEQMERVRRNMESLNRIRGQEAQVQKLASELGALQTGSAEREAELEQLNQTNATLRQELDALIASTQF